MENFIDIVSGGVLLVGALVAVLVLLWRGFLRTRLGRRVLMPPEPGALGFHVPQWVGLGIVGLWSALDAFSERANLPSPSYSAHGRDSLAGVAQAADFV